MRRFAATAVLAEATEARLVNGERIDITEFSQLSSTLVRLSSRIGLDRVPKDITPATLEDYIRARKAEAEAAEREEEADDLVSACRIVTESGRPTDEHRRGDG